MSAVAPTPPPRENLYRAVHGGLTLAAAQGEPAGTGRTLTGHFAVFDQWTEISSVIEGRFLEQVAPGAFQKTFAQQGNRIRVLLEHGNDPSVGQKPLGSITDLREDPTGAYYEVSLLDAGYVNDLKPALEAGLYGASFRFRVIREDFVARPAKSTENPNGLPTRRILEAQVFEFGPVLWGAYPAATADIRSVTDEFTYGALAADPEHLERLQRAAEARRSTSDEDAKAEALRVRLAERAAYIAGLDAKPTRRYPWQSISSLASRSEGASKEVTTRQRYEWQQFTPAATTPTKDLFAYADRSRPGYLKGEPDCSADAPKLFREGFTPRNETRVFFDANVWTRFRSLEDWCERAQYLVGYRSYDTIYVTGTEGDFTGTSRSCKVDPDVAVLFDRHQASIRSGLSIVGVLHTHPHRGQVEPSPTDLRNWCSCASEKDDRTYLGVIVAPHGEETEHQRAWGSIDRGCYIADPDGRVYFARHALEPWDKATAA